VVDGYDRELALSLSAARLVEIRRTMLSNWD
jgi:hypothetical protein